MQAVAGFPIVAFKQIETLFSFMLVFNIAIADGLCITIW